MRLHHSQSGAVLYNEFVARLVVQSTIVSISCDNLLKFEMYVLMCMEISK